jgi:hypothetical protein
MKQSKTILKSYFETGDRPTEQEFENLVDSFHHLDESLLFKAETVTNAPDEDQMIFIPGLFKDINSITIGGQQREFVGAMQFFDCIFKVSRLDNPNEFAFFKVVNIARNYVHYTSWSGYEVALDHLVSAGGMEEGALYKVTFVITGAKDPNQSYYYYNGSYIGTI